MTLLIAALTLLLTTTISGRIVESGNETSTKARAQAAADAAALAAIAEGLPYGSGSYERLATTYAESNGAVLVECECVAGSYRVQVTVEIDGVEAIAAAEIDPAFLQPAAGVSVHGLHPALAAAVDRLVMASGGSVRLISGFRTPQRQSMLWSRALQRYGDPEVADDWVARPGTSAHERGLAVDLGGDLERAVALIAELGLPLHRPLEHEPWHFELTSSK